MPLEYDQTAVRALFATEGKGWNRELTGLLNNAANPTILMRRTILRAGAAPARPYSGGAGTWHRLQPVSLGRHGQRPAGGQGNPRPLRVLVLHLQHWKSYPDLGEYPAPFTQSAFEDAWWRPGRPGSRPHGDDRPQPGRSADQADGDRVRQQNLGRVQQQAAGELNLKPKTKALLRDSLFIHPLPFVETVVFISTPHGGSYQASLTVGDLFTRLVTLPLTIAGAAADVVTNAGNDLKLSKDRRAFNSINGMSPGIR